MYTAEKSKDKIIKELIKKCRQMLRNGRDGTNTGFFSVGDEMWEYTIRCIKNKIVTDFTLYWTDGIKIQYPRTEWGNYGVRWDSDLREFLNREILKV